MLDIFCRKPTMSVDDFYVVAVMTNPERFKVRPRLFKEFMSRMDRYGAKL